MFPTQTDQRPGSLAEGLARLGILGQAGRPVNFHAPTQTLRCPRCAHRRKGNKGPSLHLKIDPDGLGAVFSCFNAGDCEWNTPQAFRVAGAGHSTNRGGSPPRVYRRPPTDHVRCPGQVVYDWFAERGISAATVDALGIRSAQVWMPQTGKPEPVIAYPYTRQGEVVNFKYRAAGKLFRQEKDAEKIVYGWDDVAREPAVIVVEGENDKAAFWEAGIRHVCSVPDGAPERIREEPDPYDPKFLWLLTCPAFEPEDRGGAAKIILAVDADGPGQALEAEVARRVGPERCWVVRWPEGCKDAGDVLKVHGPEVLAGLLDAAFPYPLKGIREPWEVGEELDALWREGRRGGVSLGWDAFDKPRDGGGPLLTLRLGELVVLTGIPGSGKSNFWNAVMVNTARLHDWVWGVCSLEARMVQHVAQLAEQVIRKPFDPGPTERMTLEELRNARAWINERFKYIEDDEAPRVEDLLDHAQTMVRRYGIKGLLVDPWTEVQKVRGATSRETDLVEDFLVRLRAWGRSRQVLVCVVAHPAKPAKDAPKVMGLYDISGCYSADTDVLTWRGWVPHPEVTPEDQVACFDPVTETLRYTVPEALHAYDYAGPMHHYTGYSLDLLVTPNHRMVVKPAWRVPGKKTSNPNMRGRPAWTREGWEFARSETLRRSKYRLPMAAPLQAAGEVPALPWIADQEAAWAFVGWFVSEGWWTMGAPAVCQAAAASLPVRDVLVRLGLPFSEAVKQSHRPNEQAMWRARLYRRGAEAFCDWLLAGCGSGAANKRLPAEVWGLPREWKETLFQALMAGDGHQRPHNPKRVKQGGCVYATTSAGLADDVQRLAIELGRYATLRSVPGVEAHHSRRYWVTIGHPDRRERVVVLPRNRAEVLYQGKVYCLTVPTGAYVTRRDGVTAICGNSAHWANKADVGLSVWRDTGDPDSLVEVHMKKVRNREVGRMGTVARLQYIRAWAGYQDPRTAVKAPPPRPYLED